MTRTLIAAAALALLAGCAGFKLGTVAYIPHGQFGTVTVGPEAPAKAASTP